MFHFGTASLRRLNTCHEDIQTIVMDALAHSPADFTITDGLRGEAAQEAAFEAGNSKAHFGQSPHNFLVRNDGGSPAVDIVPYVNGRLAYDDDAAFTAIAEVIHASNKRLIGEGMVKFTLENGFEEWGWDKPHWQIKGWKEIT